MTISLSDLKAMRARMTPGEFAAKGVSVYTDGRSIGYTNSTPTAGIVAEADGAQEDCEPGEFAIGLANAAGIVAAVNAADALVEVAEAAIRWRDAKASLDEVVDLMNRATNSDEYCAACTLAPPRGRDCDAARDALVTALAKVEL